MDRLKGLLTIGFVLAALVGCKATPTVPGKPAAERPREPRFQPPPGSPTAPRLGPSTDRPVERTGDPKELFTPKRTEIGFLNSYPNMKTTEAPMTAGGVPLYQTARGYLAFPIELWILGVANEKATDLSRAISIDSRELPGAKTIYSVSFMVQPRYDQRAVRELEAFRDKGNNININPTVAQVSWELNVKPGSEGLVLKDRTAEGMSPQKNTDALTITWVHLEMSKEGAEFAEKVVAGRAKFSDKFEMRVCYDIEAAVPRSKADIDADKGPYVFTVEKKMVRLCPELK